jgi:hypothetical protein
VRDSVSHAQRDRFAEPWATENYSIRRISKDRQKRFARIRIGCQLAICQVESEFVKR